MCSKSYLHITPTNFYIQTQHIYANNPHKSHHFQHRPDYEDFVFECLEDYEKNPTQILIVFYEELLVNPIAFVKKLADFSGLHSENDALLVSITRSLCEDQDFPKGFYTSPEGDSVGTACQRRHGR
jgi:hypothetical protein